MIKLDKIAFNASVFEGAPLYASTIATIVTVINKETGLLAGLWDDRDGLIGKSNPFPLNEPGVIEFYADSGRYDITAVNGANVRTWKDYILGSEGGGGAVESVGAGDGVEVDSSDPANPIVSSDFSVGDQSSSYTLSSTNSNQWLDVTGATAKTITCPLESSDNLGSKFVHIITNWGAGLITIQGEGAATVQAPAGGTLDIPQNATAGIKKSSHAADTYIVFGLTESI